ncbi:hypothetical protein CPB83DRAFT_843672 [Crepidotus variabilis]|uniref:Uncharacterized protein n=1 Tax=Crepidotus variabilis TaxID=179855 RepID=A0A9P6EUN4_9AGAR|nr:hypothetical protein CPB83DRAFT_843672 [Crepidotus variabilis]
MALHLFRHILCCCGSSGNETGSGTFDETAHLIVPEIVEADDNFSDDVLASQRVLRERLTEIVRSKEGKMVNVASQIPFNLHNQVLPKTHSQSSSRSASGSFDPYYDHGYPHYSDFYANNREIARFRKQMSKYNHGLGRLRSVSPPNGFPGHHSQDPLTSLSSPRTRSPSPSADDLTSPARLLNIRLVGYSDTRIRGRARERGPNPSGLPGLRTSVNRGDIQGGDGQVQEREASFSVHEDSPTTPLAVNTKENILDSRPPVSYDLHLSDASAMIMSWGD